MAGTRRVRVLLAEDLPLVREGLREVLARDPQVEIVAEVGDGEEALARILADAPDVAVLDIAMPRMTGIEVARKVRDSTPPGRTAVVLVSIHDEPEVVREAIAAGVRGYVTKSSFGAELLAAVHAAARGGFYLSAAVAAPGAGAIASAPVPAPPAGALTPRERDVLRLLARGLSSKEIAAELGMRSTTVDGYRTALLKKVGARSLAGLVKYALKNHLATFEDP